MQQHFIEVTNGFNWGKFLVCQMTDEDFAHNSAVDGRSVLYGRGWRQEHLWVFDLQTGEGAAFRLSGSARHDLDKHRIWVCPLFEPFLEWLYIQNLEEALPSLVELPDAPSALYGYRREGSAEEIAPEEITKQPR